LAAEDYAYIDDVEDRDFPVFGRLDSDFETVFYFFQRFFNFPKI
jgi:hypothetical protein